MSVGNSCCSAGIWTCSPNSFAVNGSKFRAVNNRDRNCTKAKVQARLKQIQETIDRYLSMLGKVDRTEPAEAPAKAVRLQDKITLLKRTDAGAEGG